MARGGGFCSFRSFMFCRSLWEGAALAPLSRRSMYRDAFVCSGFKFIVGTFLMCVMLALTKVFFRCGFWNDYISIGSIGSSKMGCGACRWISSAECARLVESCSSWESYSAGSGVWPRTLDA